MSGVDVTGVATDSQDRIYVFNRGEHPVLVFESGGGFLHRWGENLFRRPHRIYIDSHDSVYCTDDEHFPLSASSTWLRDQQAWQSIYHVEFRRRGSLEVPRSAPACCRCEEVRRLNV